MSTEGEAGGKKEGKRRSPDTSPYLRPRFVLFRVDATQDM